MNRGVMDKLELALAVQRSAQPRFKSTHFLGTFPHVTNLIGKVHYHYKIEILLADIF
jgi:hypothetical protein